MLCSAVLELAVLELADADGRQFLDNHQNVGEAEWTGKAVQLPPASELPHIDMQVVNYHRPVFGTFHSKFMVVDRKIAILSSNNIQVRKIVALCGLIASS